MGRLVKQMMGAASFRYAVHHIVWEEKDGKLRATFEFVPLWFFENREGILRFRRDASGTVGDDLAEGEWMVTCSDGLMIACAIDYLAKRFAMQDWLAFSEKFSMPGILGRTSAGKGSEAGLAMKSAVENFGQDFAAVVYGDDGSAKIELIQPNGNPSAMPMPAFIERADRKMAALYRGADLSSMSSGRSGAGTGASLQQNETAILETDDCMTISETLQEIDKQVIAWHFGKGVEPRAYVKVPPPARKDHKFILEVIKTLHGMNVRIPTEDALGSLGFTEAGPGVRAIGERMTR
jgi:phage gp29-like protein